jgi:hypothetical protein
MKRLILLTGLFSLLIFQTAKATNLRGQLLRYNSYTGTNMPLAGVRVDLMIWNGAQWVDVGYSITGNDGLYYFVNVQPGVAIQILVFNRFIFTQPIGVGAINPPYFQDLPYFIT